MRLAGDNLEELLGNVLRGVSKIVGCNSTNLVVINEAAREMRVRIGTTAGVLLDETGQVSGQGPDANGLADVIQSGLGAEVRAWLADGGSGEEPKGILPDGRRVNCQRFSLGTRPAALCWLSTPAPASGDSLENQLLQLTMGKPAPALFTDPDFSITSINPAASKLFGLAPEALIGGSVDSLFCEPANISDILTRQVIAPGGPAAELEAIACLTDGGLLPARIEALLLADDRDRAIGYLILIRHTGDASQGLSPTQLVEQERLATMGEMAAQLAHEIRNPLLAIGATLEGLTREPDEQRKRKLVEAATNEISRLDMVLRKHLSARGELDIGRVLLGELATDVRRLLEGARRRQDKTIQIEVPADLAARADYEAMRHVLFNLLLNALEASPPGGVVTIRAEATQGSVALVIEDQGPGLGASAQQCMRPFFTTKSNGTGLGLAVCSKLIQAHAGVLELHDRAEGGCAARVVLPSPADQTQA